MTTTPSVHSSKFTVGAAAALALIYLPYLIKRIALVGTPGEIEWLAWDYSIRCVSLVGILVYARGGFVQHRQSRASMPKTALVFVITLAIQYLLLSKVYFPLSWAVPDMALFHPPVIRNHDLLLFDLTFGIALVALSEELAFRWVAFSLLRSLKMKDRDVLLVSSIIFALGHWTSGPVDVLNALAVGTLWGAAYCMTGRISVCVVLHYLDDFLVFGWRATLALDQAG